MKILLLDDDDNNHNVIKYALEHTSKGMPFEVVSAYSVQQAREFMAQHQYDVLITDNHLGEHDKVGGINLIRSLRSSGSTIPIVMICNEARSIPFQATARLAGADKVLSRAFQVGTEPLEVIWRAIEAAANQRDRGTNER